MRPPPLPSDASSFLAPLHSPAFPSSSASPPFSSSALPPFSSSATPLLLSLPSSSSSSLYSPPPSSSAPPPPSSPLPFSSSFASLLLVDFAPSSRANLLLFPSSFARLILFTLLTYLPLLPNLPRRFCFLCPHRFCPFSLADYAPSFTRLLLPCWLHPSSPLRPSSFPFSLASSSSPSTPPALLASSFSPVFPQPHPPRDFASSSLFCLLILVGFAPSSIVLVGFLLLASSAPSSLTRLFLLALNPSPSPATSSLPSTLFPSLASSFTPSSPSSLPRLFLASSSSSSLAHFILLVGSAHRPSPASSF